jgi:iron complex outermembrane receptor protein
MYRYAQTGLLGLVLLIVTGPAFAEIEELIVEAQHRKQSIQDVPIAVSGFSAEDIAKLQINDTSDIGANVPNLQTYAVTANGSAMQVHARGTSVQNPGFNVSESPVGLYMDDVYRGRLATANLDLNDIERIEVLRGPQATLYGRNTIAGAIKAYSRTPGDDFWASGSVGYGKYDTSKYTASVGGALKEGVLAGSLSGLYHNRDDGDQDTSVPGRDNPGEYENKAARGKLHFYGSDNLDATLTLWWVEAENDGYNGVPYVPFWLADDGNAATPPPVVPPGNPNVTLDPAAASNGSPLDGFYSNLSPDGVNYGDTRQSGLTLDWTWQFGNNLDLRSITGFADIDDDFGFDLAGGGLFADVGGGTIIGPAPGLLVASDSNMKTWSQEFQLLGENFDSQLTWIIGLYYLNEDGDQNYAGNAAPFFGFNEVTDSETNSYAVYAEGTWDFTDRWSVTAGGRWSKDDKDYDLTCITTQLGGCAPGDGAVSLSDDWDEFTPKLSLNYSLGENTLLYASIAKGFQAGGFQTLCFGSLPCAGQTYDPQKVWSYELGYKSDLFDKSLRLNAAVFLASYEDIQQSVPRFIGFPTENVDDSDVTGIELEATWIPIDNLNIFGHAGWMDSDDVDFVSDFGPGMRELPSNPDWTGRAGFNYTMGIFAELDLFFGADVTYSDEYYNDIANSILIDDYTRFNGFVGIGRPDNRWQVVGEWKNITNEEDNVSGLLVPNSTNVRTVLPPLEYMVNLKFNY